MVSTRFPLLGCLLAIATATALQAADNLADETAAASVQAISVEPKCVELSGSNRQQYLLVAGQLGDGRLIDLSRATRFDVANARQ